ncbi:udp-glucoronosyl and udp-glucosyl transferase family protein [Colletotrichum camelliae]|nr:udp-glucoronosyl and udp-glucosyl transferase family protein [Colletotrichum camelliae]
MPIPGKRKILILSDCDFGQANVVLSTVYALVRADPDVEIHVASQAGMQGQLSLIIKQVSNDLGSAAAESIKAHSLVGLSHWQAMEKPGNPNLDSWACDPTIPNMVSMLSVLPGITLPWSAEEFVEIYRDVERVWNEVQPDVTVVENFFAPALTFCHNVRPKIPWIVLAPNTIKEFALSAQPGLPGLWKYPIFNSAFSYPVPLHQIPTNIFYNIVAMIAIFTRLQLITVNELGLLAPPPPGIRVMVANSPDIDFPFDVIPDFMVPCGPITRPAAPISSEDPELAIWLGRGPTVYMNLGTHRWFDVAKAREIAYAFRSLFDAAKSSPLSNLQLIWKMPRAASEGDTSGFEGPWKEIKDILESEIDQDRVRIVDWITAEPKSLLQSGHIVCSVNHGGSNSFHEAICCGIPQVILPGWADCYDFALRAELLGIGKWASRTARPLWKRDELAKGLEEVLLGPEAMDMSKRAQELAKRHPEDAGRDRAAEEILKLLENNNTNGVNGKH